MEKQEEEAEPTSPPEEAGTCVNPITKNVATHPLAGRRGYMARYRPDPDLFRGTPCALSANAKTKPDLSLAGRS